MEAADDATAKAEHAGQIRFDRYVLDLQRGCLSVDGTEVALRPKTFELLCHLVTNHGRLVTKDELMAAIWANVVVTDDSIVQCIAELRRALVDKDHQLIRTVARRGYRLEAVPAVEPPPACPTVRRRESPLSGYAPRHAALWGSGIVFLLAVVVAATIWIFRANTDSAAPPLSIVVLPFEHPGADPEEAHIAGGVAGDLTTDLSRIPGLFVIAHATARTFTGSGLDALQFGRELNVRYVLAGRIDRMGDTVRINAELVSADNGAVLWADRLVTTPARIAATRDEIVGRIANTLNFRLTGNESERALRERQGDPTASDLTTRGWAFVYAGKKPDNYEKARNLFLQAVERGPQAVNALAGVGWTSAVMVLDGWSTSRSADIALADNAVTQALTVDRNHVIAHHVRGFLYRLQRRSSAARDSFNTAIALNPNFAPGHAQLGITELELGRPEAVIPAVEKAIRLSPRDPSLGPWLAFLGMAQLHLGNPDEAIVWLSRAIDTGTPVALHRAYLASALASAGHNPEAEIELAAFRQAAPMATISSLRANARSTEPAFINQQERLFEGLRIAGLPD